MNKIVKSIKKWRSSIGQVPSLNDVYTYVKDSKVINCLAYSTITAVLSSSIAFIMLPSQPFAILSVLGFSFVATSALFYMIADVGESEYILKSPYQKSEISDEIVTVFEETKEEDKKPEIQVIQKKDESIYEKGFALTKALSEYRYSAGGSKICVGVTHYNDEAPMVIVYKIIPVNENNVFKREVIEGELCLNSYTGIDIEKFIKDDGKISDIIKRGVNLNVLSDLGDNLSRDLGLPKGQKISVDVNVGGGQAAIYLPKENRDWVYLNDYLETIENSSAIVPMFLGKTLEGDSLIVDMVDARHSAIIGMNKSGKTISMIAQLLGLAYARSPEQVEIMLIDPKFVGFNILKQLPHVKTGVITDLEKALYQLENVEKSMNERYIKLQEADVQDIVEYNKVSNDKMSYLLIAIDEFLDLLEDDTTIENEDGKTTTIAKRSRKVLGQLFKKGRGCGIHVNVLSQRFSAEDVPGAIRNNAGLRMCLSVTDKHASRMVIDEAGGETLLGYGDTLTKLQDWNASVRSQGAGFKNDSLDIKQIVEMIKTKWSTSEEKGLRFELIETQEV